MVFPLVKYQKEGFFYRYLENYVRCLYKWSVLRQSGLKIRPLHIVMVYFINLWSFACKKWSVFPSMSYTNEIWSGLSFRPTPILKIFFRPTPIQYLLIYQHFAKILEVTDEKVDHFWRKKTVFPSNTCTIFADFGATIPSTTYTKY